MIKPLKEEFVMMCKKQLMVMLCSLFAITFAMANCSMAQNFKDLKAKSTVVEKSKQKPMDKAAKLGKSASVPGRLINDSSLYCNFYIDGRYIDKIEPGAQRAVSVSPGTHNFKVCDPGDTDHCVCHQSLDIEEGDDWFYRVY